MSKSIRIADRSYEQVMELKSAGYESITNTVAVAVDRLHREERMTTTVFARGSKWGSSQLYADWGDIPAARAELLSDLVVERFEGLAGEAGDPSIHWQPATSEVLGEVYGQDTEEHSKWDPIHDIEIDLDALLEQAVEEVLNAVCDETTPMTDRVQAILTE